MSDYYTFIVLSTTNTSSGALDSATRFQQLIDSFVSIRKQVANAKIIAVDNSTVPLTQQQTDVINQHVDLFHPLQHNVATKFINMIATSQAVTTGKALGEAYMMDVALTLAKQHNLVGKRVFKLSGRYRLANSFDIQQYQHEKYQHKYAFKVTLWAFKDHNDNVTEHLYYFETRLWSLCSSLIDQYQLLLQHIYNFVAINIRDGYRTTYENAHYRVIPHESVVDIDTVHVEGLLAPTGEYKFE